MDYFSLTQSSRCLCISVSGCGNCSGCDSVTKMSVGGCVHQTPPWIARLYPCETTFVVRDSTLATPSASSNARQLLLLSPCARLQTLAPPVPETSQRISRFFVLAFVCELDLCVGKQSADTSGLTSWLASEVSVPANHTGAPALLFSSSLVSLMSCTVPVLWPSDSLTSPWPGLQLSCFPGLKAERLCFFIMRISPTSKQRPARASCSLPSS